jgi:hypothetical protein
MTYKIKQFNEVTGQLTIEFDPTVSPFSVDVPLNQAGLYITGEELDAYIRGFAPTDFINRGKQIAAGITNSAELKALETEPLPADQTQEQLQAIEEARAAEVEKHVKAALIKLGVISV